MTFESLSDADLQRFAEKCTQDQFNDGPRFGWLLFIYGLLAGMGGVAVMFDQPATTTLFRVVTITGLVALGFSWKMDKDLQRRKATAVELYQEARREIDRRRRAAVLAEPFRIP